MNNQNQDMDAIYDAKKLGPVKAGLLGFQHLFAMFGATVLVPTLTGLSVSSTLLLQVLARCSFTCSVKARFPLSSAPLSPFGRIFCHSSQRRKRAFAYACFGVLSGFMYVILAFFIKIGGVKELCATFLYSNRTHNHLYRSSLSGSAITNASSKLGSLQLLPWSLVVLCNIWGKE